MRGPGIPKKQKRTALCYNIDIYPSLCELAGVAPPRSVEGRSLKAVIDSPSEPHRSHLHLAYRHLMRGVSSGRHKLIEHRVNGKRTPQLFDLWQDPWEMRNLADSKEHAGIVSELRAEMEKWRSELGDTRPEHGGAFWGKETAGVASGSRRLC
jgi:arylsulfatase A-like enzyme